MFWKSIAAFLVALAALTAPAALSAQMPDDPEMDADLQADNERMEAEWSLLKIGLSDDLDEQQRAAVMEVIEGLDEVAIAAQPTHAIAPHPWVPEMVVLHEIPGAGPVHHRALFAMVRGAGATTLEDIYEHFSPDYRRDYYWGSDIALPTELGDSSDPVFKTQLRAELQKLRRRAALIRFARNADRDDVTVCIANRRPDIGSCPNPIDNARRDEVTADEPIYLSVEADLPEPRFATLVAISRDGTIRHLYTNLLWTAFAVMPEVRADVGAEDAPVIGESQTMPRQRGGLLIETGVEEMLPPGQHELFVITSRNPITPAIWDRTGDDPPSPEICHTAIEQTLCEAMRGERPSVPFEWQGDVGYIPVGVRIKIYPLKRVVRGNPASRSVSLWQAQLVRYRITPGSDGPTGRRTFDIKESHKCGGAYLGEGFVLTAAHCIPDDTSEMRIRMGTRNIKAGGTLFKVRSIARHKDGMAREGRVDLAVIQIAASDAQLKKLGSELRPINPARDPERDFESIHGLTVTGWGFLKPRLPGEKGWLAADGSNQSLPDKLMQLRVEPAAMNECSGRSAYSEYRAEDILCLRSAVDGGDTCSGDSGGPVTARGDNGRELVGIVSKGVGCAYKDIPSVYINVARHRDWIDRMKTLLKNSRPGVYSRK